MVEREKSSLNAIKHIVDCYRNGNITITTGHNDLDGINHIHDVSVIMGMIQNHAYQGLGLDIPPPVSKKESLETILISRKGKSL